MTLDPQDPAAAPAPTPVQPTPPPPTGTARPGPPPAGYPAAPATPIMPAAPTAPPPYTGAPPPAGHPAAPATPIMPAAPTAPPPYTGAPPPAYQPIPPRPASRSRTGLILGLAGGGVGLLLLITIVIVGLASLTNDQANREDALARYVTAETALIAAVDRAEADVAEADEVLALGADPLLPTTELGTIEQTRSLTAGLLPQAQTALAVDEESLSTGDVQRATSDVQHLTNSLADADLTDALTALLTATATGASSVEGASFDAENAPRIAFRAARDGLDTASADQVGESLTAYLGAATALAASHAEEIAEKAGPLFDARMTVQEFARSMAGDVMLQFDWAPVVNGYGLGGSYGGTSYWTTADGAQATLTLSDSVAAMWPGAGVQALVVHEVGHAVLARSDCNTLFFDSEYASGGEEPWATAWAIGLGYTADGSGESIYGRPSDALIDLASQCR